MGCKSTGFGEVHVQLGVIFNLKEEMMIKKILAMGVITLSACASNPENIEAAYTHHSKYEGETCRELALEQDELNRRVQHLYNSLDAEASADAAQMAVGMVLFWPALFFLEGGDGPEADEYSRLKGDQEAIGVAMAKKNC